MIMVKPIAVQVANLSFSYDSKPIFSNLTFHLHEKELTTLIGPNGAGKTTLLKLLLGLLKPTAGTIHIFGKSPETCSELIGYVPQNLLYDTLFPITVKAVIAQGLLGTGLVKKDLDAKLAESLEYLGIESLKNKRFSELSGGQRRKVLIARALAAQPRLLILDEPNANLDVDSVRALYELLADLKKSTTVLLVTHDISLASITVDRVLCLGDVVQETQSIHEHTLDKSITMIDRHYGGQAVLVRHDIDSHEHECCKETAIDTEIFPSHKGTKK